MPSLLSQTKSILREFGLRPQKRLGQSFLIDANILNKILEAAQITFEDTVLEIGPGTGVLTEVLLNLAAGVIAVEYDKGLYEYLLSKYSENKRLVLVQGDYLKVDFSQLFSPSPPAPEKVSGYRFQVSGLNDKAFKTCPLSPDPCSLKLVANLPYYISTPLLFKLIDERRFFEYAILMLQKEVVNRLTARPGTKDYGALTVNVALYTRVEKIAPVSRHCFYPAPEVDSAIIKLTFRERPAVEVKDEELFQQVVRAAFGQRRKTLYNALVGADPRVCPAGEGGHMGPPLQIKQALAAAGIDGKRRGETLSLEEFARLSNILSEKAKT